MTGTKSDGAGVATQRIGEVVESASHRYTAQCYRLYESPPLGAFVSTEYTLDSGITPAPDTGPSRIYAVVYGVITEALDPSRPVVARGEEEDSEEGIYHSNPQLARLLCTRFEALIVGHSNGTAVSQYLPPLPPRIHSFVHTCTPQEVEQFTSKKLDFLNLLVNAPSVGRGVTDEVVAACLRQASTHLSDSGGFLVHAGKALARQLTGDLLRLNSILKRLSP